MRLIHIITSLEKGGAEEMLRRLLKINKDPKVDTLVITITGNIKPDEEIKLYGYEVYPLKISGILSLITGTIKLFFKIRTFKPDVIQTWLYHSDLIGGIVGRLALVPTVVWNIRCEALNVQRAGRKTMVIFDLCKFFSHIVPKKIVCVGERARDTHIKAGFCESKMEVIFNGYEVEKFNFSTKSREIFRQEFKAADEEILIGCVGRFHQDKGQDLLVKAATKILKDTKNVNFVFVGRGCVYDNPEIQQLNIEEGLRNKILMVGEKKDVADLLSSFDIYCMPSRSEGFPNSLAEAMLTELPCVAANVGDTANLAGGVLTLVEPNNADLIEVKLRELISLGKEERTLLGKKARQQVVNNFSLKNAQDQFNSLYKKIMGQ